MGASSGGKKFIKIIKIIFQDNDFFVAILKCGAVIFGTVFAAQVQNFFPDEFNCFSAKSRIG